MTLIAILMGTLAAGIGSVWLAALLSFGVLARYTQHMLSLAAKSAAARNRTAGPDRDSGPAARAEANASGPTPTD